MKEYIAHHEERFLNELFSLLRIPSISAEPSHHADMLRCADLWRELLLQAICPGNKSTSGTTCVEAEAQEVPHTPRP